MQTKLSDYKTRQRSALNLVVRTGPEADRVDDSVFEVTRSCVREGQPSDPNGLQFSQVKPSNRGKNSNPFGPIRHPHSLRRSPGTLSSLRYTEGPGGICLLTTSQPLGCLEAGGLGAVHVMSLGHMSFTFGGVTTPKPASPDSPIRAKEGNTQNTSRNPSTEVGKTTRSLRDDVIFTLPPKAHSSPRCSGREMLSGPMRTPSGTVQRLAKNLLRLKSIQWRRGA